MHKGTRLKKSKSRPKLSQALIELRTRLEDTQESMSRRLDVSMHSIAIWETKRAPAGVMLLRLSKLAEEHQHADLAKIFADAVENEKRLDHEDLLREARRWADLFNKLALIQKEANRLHRDEADSRAVRLGVAHRIMSLTNEMETLAHQAQAWSWRNQR
jgi:transcriptional regulator with XRE-family HTH domain